MNWNIKREIVPLIVFGAFIIITLIFYPQLPEQMPSRFNIRGEPVNFFAKNTAMWFSFLQILVVYLLLTFIPMIDPFWRKIKSKYSLFLLLRDIGVTFFLFFYGLIIYAALNGELKTYLLGIAFGLLFLVLGNYLPKLPRNFFVGIRNPWTLSSETVWKKTHILGGWLFVAGGLMAVLLSLFKVNLVISLSISLGPVILVTHLVYPLLLYRKLQRDSSPNVPQL